MTSERAASVTSAWRWSEPTSRAASVARPGTRSGCTTTCPAVPIVARARASMLRCAASTTAPRDAKRRRGRGRTRYRHVVGRLRFGVALEVDHRDRELQPADAVGDRVVHLLQQRAPGHRSRPSMTVNSHSGRARSRGCSASAPQRSSNARSSPGAGTATHAHVRVEIERRDRRRTRAARCAAARRRRVGPGAGLRRARAASSRAGGRRSVDGRGMVRLQKSDRSAGSFSTAHMIASRIRHPHGQRYAVGRPMPSARSNSSSSSSSSGSRIP